MLMSLSINAKTSSQLDDIFTTSSTFPLATFGQAFLMARTRPKEGVVPPPSFKLAQTSSLSAPPSMALKNRRIEAWRGQDEVVACARELLSALTMNGLAYGRNS